MFKLSRPQRQVLATVALVAFSVMPTAYVAWAAVRIHRPGHIRDVEVEVGRQLGLQVTLEGVRYPRPGEVVYRGVVLRQEEQRRGLLPEIARAAAVRLRRSGRELTIEADGLRLRGDGPRQAIAQVGALLQRARFGTIDRVGLAARTCEVELGEGGSRPLRYALRDVAGTFQVDRGAASLTVSYRVPGDDATTRCELALTRDRRGSLVRTALVFRTAEGLPLSARVLDPFFATEDWLGPAARVEGELRLEQAGGSDWEAEFQGQLLDLDLATLVGRRFPDHRLTGRARVALRSAKWGRLPGQGYGWVEAQGELATGQGTISPGLIRALQAEMRFRPTNRLARLNGQGTDLEFRTFGFTFALHRDGEIQIAGGLGGDYPPDVVLVDDRAALPLAYAPLGASNVRGLIKTLFPVAGNDRTVLVPGTAESQVLQRYLPLPPSVAGSSVRINAQ